MLTSIHQDAQGEKEVVHGGARLPRNLIIGVLALVARKRNRVGCILMAGWDAMKLRNAPLHKTPGLCSQILEYMVSFLERPKE